MRYTNKKILKITFPVLVCLLMEQLIGLTDTAYLGRVGEAELGASALAGIFYLMIFMLGFGFSIGAQILIARRNGAKEYSQIGPLFMQSTAFLLLMALVLFILSKVFAARIMGALIEAPDVREAAVRYLDYRVYGFFFAYVGSMFRAFYVGTTRTRILTINSIVMVLTNVVLNYLLIFGKFGFPEMGIAGAAIASSISEGVSALFYILYTRYRTDWRRYKFRFTGFDFSLLKQILSLSVWVMIQQGVAFLAWFLFFLCIEHLGKRDLAATNIVRAVSSLIFLFINAFASTTSSLVSNLIGAGLYRTDHAPLPEDDPPLFLLRPPALHPGGRDSLLDAPHLYGRRISDRIRHPFALGNADDQHSLHGRLHLSIQRIGYGQHPHGPHDRRLHQHRLCRLYGAAGLRTACRRRTLLDRRPRLLRLHPHGFLSLYALRQLACPQDLTPDNTAS